MPENQSFENCGGVGKASLEIFMIHAIPMMLIEKYHLVFEHHNLVMIGLCLIVLLLGVGTHKLYEKAISIIKL